MTPQQKIKREILVKAMQDDDEFLHRWNGSPLTEENIDEAWLVVLADHDQQWDYLNEFREGSHRTGLDCDWSRHYESHAVARKLHDGTWVGWTYWYGGGKHGDPESIEWMPQAYEVDCVEEEKLVTVCTFTKKS